MRSLPPRLFKPLKSHSIVQSLTALHVLSTTYCPRRTVHCLLTTAYCPLPHIPNVPGPFVKTGFFITLGFFATNEAAAEIENPFDGGANDLPLEYYLREFVEGLNDLNQAGGTDTPFSVGNKSFNLSEVGSYCQHTPPRHMSYVDGVNDSILLLLVCGVVCIKVSTVLCPGSLFIWLDKRISTSLHFVLLKRISLCVIVLLGRMPIGQRFGRTVLPLVHT